ncbi:MAG: DNA-directed RNA polymerase subunit alpha C-terminal domain-containing protein [Patescibacteria group bacterium]
MTTIEKIQEKLSAYLKRLTKKKGYQLLPEEHLDVSVQVKTVPVEPKIRVTVTKSPENMNLRDLGFSNRVLNVLVNNTVSTLEDLLRLTPIEVLRMRNSSHITLSDIRFTLARHKFALKDSPIWAPESFEDLGMRSDVVRSLKKKGINSIQQLLSHTSEEFKALDLSSFTHHWVCSRIHSFGMKFKE